MLTRRASLAILGSVFWILGGPLPVRSAESLAPAKTETPNIIVILADDLGWADLGCYGSKFHKTPHLDALAQGGLRFTHGYAACPVCSPTRAALLTGQSPARLQLTDWLPGQVPRPGQRMVRPADRRELPLEATTLAELLRTRGYATAHVGKWHLGGDGFGPQQQGFDVNIGGDHTGTPLSYFAPYQRQGRFSPGLEEAPAGEYLTDRLTTEAIRYIKQSQTGPFLLYLAHNAVHTPLVAKPELIEKFAGAPDSPGTQRNAIYAAMLHSLDDSVGRIMATLDELQIRENTLVVFTSDNGGLATIEGPNTPATINSPLREGKGYLYEGGIRVPYIFNWPGVIAPGQVSETAIQTQDLLPTIAELTASQLPEIIDGTSLVPLLKQSGELPARPLYWHYPHYSNQGGRPGGAIRDGKYKLIEFYDTGRRELFDVSSNSGESQNLVEQMPEVVTRLADQLHKWRTAVGAQMMPPNPNYVPNPQADDGTVLLPGATAEVHGVMLRYEPLPHKATLGYWVRAEDYATWEFTIEKPGSFQIEAAAVTSNAVSAIRQCSSP